MDSWRLSNLWLRINFGWRVFASLRHYRISLCSLFLPGCLMDLQVPRERFRGNLNGKKPQLDRENKVYCARNFVNFPRFKANCVKSASKQEIFFFLPPAQVFKSIFCVIIINFPLLSANCGSERQIIESRCAIFCMQLAPLPSPRDLMLLNSRPEKCKNFQRPALANHEHIEIILKLCCQKYKSISLKEEEIERVARHESRLFQRIQSALVSRSF